MLPGYGERQLSQISCGVLPGIFYRTDDTSLTGTRVMYRDSIVALEGPSWSWASNTAAVNFPPSRADRVQGQCATILDVRCDNKGRNPFGGVTKGILQIVGPLRQFRIISSQSDPDCSISKELGTTGSSSGRAPFTPDKLLVGKQSELLQTSLNVDQPLGHRHNTYYQPQSNEKVWCLGICKSYGLILRKSSLDPLVYNRIGLCDYVGSLLQGAPIEQIVIT